MTAPARVRSTESPTRLSVVTLSTTALQDRFVGMVLDGRWRYLALGGAIRGGKTFTLLVALMVLMRLYPRSRWAIVREDWTALQQNTIPSIEKVRETMGGWLGPINLRTRTYTAANGSELLLVPESIKVDPDLNSFKGFEVNGFALEEGNELAQKTFHKAIERAGAWVIPPDEHQRERGELPAQPPPRVLVSFNPSDEWTDEVFHEPFELGTLKAPYAFLPAKIKDNPHLSPGYLESLEELREAAPEEYARFVEGKRGAISQPNQLITADWLIKARDVPHEPGDKREAVDVARFGDDESVFAGVDGNALVDVEGHAKWDTAQTGARALVRAAERGVAPDDYAVDTVGLGAGTRDHMGAAGFKAREFIAGAKPVVRIGSFWSFTDLRSQAWWEFREKLRVGRFRLDPAIALRNPEAYRKLIKDLTAPRYDIVSERTIKVWSTEKIKAVTGRSPDYGTAVVMAAFDWPPPIPPPTHNFIRGSRRAVSL